MRLPWSVGYTFEALLEHPRKAASRAGDVGFLVCSTLAALGVEGLSPNFCGPLIAPPISATGPSCLLLLLLLLLLVVLLEFLPSSDVLGHSLSRTR